MESIKAIISCCSFQNKAEEQAEGSQNTLPVPTVSLANPIEKAQPMKNVFENVKKEAESVAAVIKQFFEETFGKVFSSCSMAQQESQETSYIPTKNDNESSDMNDNRKNPPSISNNGSTSIFPDQKPDQDPNTEEAMKLFNTIDTLQTSIVNEGSTVIPIKEETIKAPVVTKEKKPISPTKSSVVSLSYAWSGKNYLNFKRERNGTRNLLSSHNALVAIKVQECAEAEDEQKKAGISKDLLDFRKKLDSFASDLATTYAHYPDFRDKLRSREGFPFKMFFDNQELEQEKISKTQLYPGIMQDLPRNSTNFEKTIEQKLKDWSGQNEIDPTSSSDIATQAQLILVRISENNGPFAQSDLLVLDDDDKEHQPKTLPETISVYFEKRDGQPIMRVERQVETRDKKRYSWSETISFAGPNPVATRTAKELPDQGRF